MMAMTNGIDPPQVPDYEGQIMEWNKNVPDPELACVHNLIEQNSRSQPDAPAICAWDGQFSYQEVEVHSTILAQHLMQLGAQKEQFVPLCFGKSAFAVISLVAVLKAGAACVFLDPAHPFDRLQTMIEDVRANILLCSPGVRPKFDVTKLRNLSCRVVTQRLLDSLQDPNSSLPVVHPEDAAIGLFTSGSTGKPKGIIQNHSTAAFSAQTCSRVFEIKSGSRVLQWAAYCFDMSVIDMLMTLVGGACICIPSEKDQTDNLIQAMRDMAINVAAMTPSFAQTIKSEGVESLTTLVFGGESVSRDHLAGWPDSIRIINAYGPAEGSVCVAGPAQCECPSNVGKAVGSVTWIADEADPTRLVSIGAVGELLIEGPLLARGYLNDSEKTAASFIEDLPWLVRARETSKLPRRVYKTGDLARYDKDGSIIIMGRKDTQIKLRGQRIEAAEVEHNIKSLLPASFTVIVDVVALLRRAESQTLVAFIGARAKADLDSDIELLSVNNAFKEKLTIRLQAIERGLKNTLPTYMIPHCFIPLRFIPLTSSGKIDRKRIKIIGSDAPSTVIQYLPGEPLHDRSRSCEVTVHISLEEVAELWQWTLGLETRPKDLASNFFELGGDSIMAIKLATMARNAGLSLTTKQIFEHRTLTAMASVATLMDQSPNLVNGNGNDQRTTLQLDGKLLKGIFCPGHMLVESGVEDIVDAPDMQAFMVVSGLLRSHGYINYFAFEIDGDVNPDRIELACKTLVQQHSTLRTIFGIRAGRVVQIVLKSYDTEFRRHSSQSSTELLLSRISETEQTCHSRLGDKIVRFILIERNSTNYTLIMRISHAQFDGTSLGLIYNDLQKAYDGQTLDPVPQFTDFSKAIQKENDAAAEEYWRNLLSGSSMTSIMDHNKPCYANVINDKRALTIPFTGVGRSNITVATVVKAAWALVLAEIASTRDVVFGYAVTGREIPLQGVEKTVGDCNNAALHRIIIKDTDTALDLLNRIQTQYIETIPYQSIGLRQMVERCTDWWRSTRYSSSVNHQNYADADVDTFKLGEADCKVSYRDFEVDRRDAQVYSWPPKDGQIKVAMAFCNKIVSADLARTMLKALGKNIQTLNVDLNARLAIPSTSFCHIPLQTPSADNGQEGTLPRPLEFGFSMLDPDNVVSRVWERFLSSCDKDLFEGFDVTEKLPFYTFAGDLVYSAQLSALYEEEGISFPMELLIENATRRSQQKLLKIVLK